MGNFFLFYVSIMTLTLEKQPDHYLCQASGHCNMHCVDVTWPGTLAMCHLPPLPLQWRDVNEPTK